MLVITGGGDDLIEVAGDLHEEFPYNNDKDGDLLAFSDGTLLKVQFDSDGIWRITPLARGTATLTIEQTTDDDGTDRAVLVGVVTWVVQGLTFHRVKTT